MWQQHLTRRKQSQTAQVATSPQRLAFFILGPRIIHFLFCPKEQLRIPVRILSCPQFPHHPLTSSKAPSGRQAGRQTGDTLPNLQQNRLWGSAGALWSSLFTQFNRFRYNLLCQLGNCSQLGHLSLQQVAVCLSLTTASWGNCLKADCEEQSHGHISLDHVQP